jgi:hypothetical protein
MQIPPQLDEIVNGQRGILRGIEICLENQCLVSGVALIFSAIDSLAALTRSVQDSDTSRGVFIDWVERFFPSPSGLACNALDLYAARCGVLHTYSPESRLRRDGSARPLIYQWHGGPAPDPNVLIPPRAITVEIETLHEAFISAVHEFLSAVDTDSETRRRVTHHLPDLLCYRPWPPLGASLDGGI